MPTKNRTVQISICDDERGFCSELEQMLRKIADQLTIQIRLDVWYSGETMQDYLSRGNRADIVFLDIELMRVSGIDVGNYIRHELHDHRTQIVYVSSKSNYASRLFRTHPYDFLLKPVEEKALYEVMKELADILYEKNYLMEYRNGKASYQVNYDEVLYFTSKGHKVSIIMMGEEREFYGKLKEVAEQAPPQFLTIHKSYLVNRDYVERYTFQSVEMKNKEELPISKAYQKIVREQLRHKRRPES